MIRGASKGVDAAQQQGYPQLKSIDHVHTAGNSPTMADAAALMLLGEESLADKLDIKPRARILAAATQDEISAGNLRVSGELPADLVGGGISATAPTLCVSPKTGTTLVTDSNTWKSDCLVFDATDIEQGPIAKVHLPDRVPNGFHSTWARGEDLFL